MKKKFNIIVVIVLLLVAISGVYKYIQNDTFYSLKIGEDILKYGVDMIDHYSFHDLEYTYPHWFYDLVLSRIYKIGGFLGLYITNIIILFLTSLSGYYFLNKHTNNKFMSLVFASILSYLIGANVTSRAQSISYLIFILEIINIEAFLKKGKIKNLVILYFLLVLLFNVHMAVYPLYFVIFIPYIAEYLISNIVRTCHINNKLFNLESFVFEENKNIKKLAIFMPILLTAGLLTPVGLNAYTYIFKNLSGYSVNFIVEHKPAVLMDLPEFYVVLLTLIISMFILKIKFKLRDIFMLGGFIIMGFQACRNITLFYIMFSLFFGRNLINYINKNKIKIHVLPILIIGIILCLTRYNTVSKYDYTGKDYPKDAIKYIKKNLNSDDIKIYNEYDIGAYLLFEDIKVFVDSRSDLYELNFNKQERSILQDTYLDYDNYEEILDHYDITHLLLYKSKPILNYLKLDKNYKEIYSDDFYVIIERKTV